MLRNICFLLLFALTPVCLKAQSPPLGVQDVVMLLGMRETPREVIAQMITESCISFEMDGASESQLRKAGADNTVVAAARTACVKGIVPKLSPRAGGAQAITLTKEETVDYINKKLNEVVGTYSSVTREAWHPPVYKPLADQHKGRAHFTTAKVVLAGSRLTLSVTFWDPAAAAELQSWCVCQVHRVTHTRHYTFSPTLISGFEPLTVANSPVGFVDLTFAQPAATVSGDSEFGAGTGMGPYALEPARRRDAITAALKSEGLLQRIWLPVLQADPSNFDKLIKAFKHLQALLKTEHDPFGR